MRINTPTTHHESPATLFMPSYSSVVLRCNGRAVSDECERNAGVDGRAQFS